MNAVLWVCVAIVALGVVATFIHQGLQEDWGWACIAASIAAILAGLFAAILSLVATLIVSPIVGYRATFRDQPLVALTDERDALGGAFFLGSGVVGSSAVYTFYTAEPNGARQMHQEDVGKVMVFEDTDKPYVTWETGCRSNHPAVVDCIGSGIGADVLREIHVPSGSIKTGIALGVPKGGEK